jgi:uncharacterized membrane protein YqjE
MDNSNEAAMRHGKESDGIDLLRTLRIVRSAGGALCTQANLYGKLARIEWLEEKNRLMKMFMFGLMGFACLLCVMLFIGLLVVILSWDSAYRVLAISSIIILYGVGIGISWLYFHALSALNTQSFAATREELATDLALLKSRL